MSVKYFRNGATIENLLFEKKKKTRPLKGGAVVKSVLLLLTYRLGQQDTEQIAAVLTASNIGENTINILNY